MYNITYNGEGQLVNLPECLQDSQAQSSFKNCLESNNIMLWRPVGHSPQTYRSNPVPVRLVPLTSFSRTAIISQPPTNPTTQHTQNSQRCFPGASTAVQQIQQMEYPDLYRDNTFSRDAKASEATVLQEKPGVAPILQTKYQEMFDAGLTYFDESEMSVCDSLEDIKQISNMLSSPRALNDSGFLNNFAEGHLQPNPTTSKTVCTNYQKFFSCDLSYNESDSEVKNDISLDEGSPSGNRTKLQNINKEPSDVKAVPNKCFYKQSVINFMKDKNLLSHLDDVKVKVAMFLDANIVRNDTVVPSDDDCLSEPVDSKLENMTRFTFQDVHNMPRMNWNFDLKIVEKDRIVPYVSADHMLYGSASSRFDKEFLADLRKNYESPVSDDSFSEGVTIDTTAKRSRIPTVESLNNSSINPTSSPATRTSNIHSWDTDEFDSDVASSNNSTGEVSQCTYGSDSQSHISRSVSYISVSSSKSSFQATNTSVSGSVIDLTSDYLKHAVTSANICTLSVSTEKEKEPVLKNTQIKSGSKRKAQNMTDLYIPLTKRRPIASSKINPVQLPNQQDQQATSNQNRELTFLDTHDVAEPALHPPAAPKKKVPHWSGGPCRDMGSHTPNISNGKGSYDAAITAVSLTRSKARRCLFVGTEEEEDEDDTFIIPRMLKKLFN